MAEKRTSIFDNALIWFGAGVSLAEILTGTFLAPLGFSRGLLSIIVGHVIGCFLLFLAGYMGGKKRMSAMETVTLSFGGKGAFLFAILNVLQLVGWTAIMIYDGALAANGALACGKWVWALVSSCPLSSSKTEICRRRQKEGCPSVRRSNSTSPCPCPGCP